MPQSDPPKVRKTSVPEGPQDPQPTSVNPESSEVTATPVAIPAKDDNSDPELIAKRQKAGLKNKLAAGADAAIKKAASSLARNEDLSRLQCLSVYIFAVVISLAFALHVYLLNDPIGPPPTREAHWAASWLLFLLLVNACISTSGFVILYLKFSQLVIGFTFLTMLTSIEYYTTIVISQAAVTIHKGTFEDIKTYSKDYYNDYRLIPEYVSYYEINGKCCGWGDPDKKYNAWPNLLETTDLPDTCCIKRFYGCGREAVPRAVPSGHMMLLSSTEYADLLANNKDYVDTELWKNETSTLGKVLKHFPAIEGIPDELLRLVDQIQDNQLYYYLGEEANVVYVYHSFGQIENYRLRGSIKYETCNTDIILRDTKFHTMFVLIYSSVLLLICFLMSIVFWYYFVENRAELLAAESLPGDFTALQMEIVCLDDKYEAIIKERNRLEKIRELRKREYEEERKRKKLLKAAEAEKEKTAGLAAPADAADEKGTVATKE